MRTNLQVPFAEKDEAKRLGARWDAARKVWYVENKADMAPFARWMSATGSSAGASSCSAKSSVAGKDQSKGILIVGSRYVAQAPVCDCLPWDVCDRCRPTAFNI